MDRLWPWLALAGVGALHGLNPAGGWIFAAACGLRAHDGREALRALLPLALGHLASIALVAGAVLIGWMDRRPLQLLAGGLLLLTLGLRWVGHGRIRGPAGQIGLALWSFIVSTAQGAGLMLVPALAPLCLAGTPAREITASGSLLLALAAAAVHGAAMLIAGGLMASGLCRGWAAIRGRRRRVN